MIENKIYASIIVYCEKLEAKGIYRGNGHHLAQRLTAMVSAGILPSCKKKIYDALCEVPRSTKDIAKDVNMNTKIVSSQLRQMCDNTTLVLVKKLSNKRRNIWFRA